MRLTFSLISLPFKSLIVMFTNFYSYYSCVGESDGSIYCLDELSVFSSSASAAFCAASEATSKKENM